MPTSYSNPGGTGDRRRMIIVTAATLSVAGSPSLFVDGDTATNGQIFWSGSLSSSDTLTFDFGDSSYVIDEIKFYQQTTDSHGTWQCRGSNDGATWTNIGSTFTLGGSATQTITAPSGNTTDFKQLQLQGVSGSVSGSPWLYEFEFKISPLVSRTNGSTTGYSNSGGIGDRTSGSALIHVSAADNGGGFLSSTGTDTADLKTLIDGTLAVQTSETLANPTAASGYVQFDFGSQRQVDEAVIWTGGNSGSFGTFKWRGSNDASTWTDLATGISFLTPSGGGGSSASRVQIFRELNSNTTLYQYLRMECTSGSATSLTGMTEFEFRIDALPPMPSVSDAVTVSESVTPEIVDFLAVSDSAAVSESITINRIIPGTCSVSDPASTSEVVTLSVSASASVSDSATVAESVTASIPATLSASVSDSATVAEAVTAAIPGPTLSLSISDSVTLHDLLTAATPLPLRINMRTPIYQTTVSSAIPTPINLVAMDATTDATTLSAAATSSQIYLLLASLSGLTVGDYLLLNGAERALTTALNDGSTIASSVLNAGGSGYVIGNTGTITNLVGGTLATYVVNTLSGSAVATYTITNLTDAYGYTTASGFGTVATTGVGSGFTVDITANGGHAVTVARGQAGTAAQPQPSSATVVDVSLGNEVVNPTAQTVLFFQNSDSSAHTVTVYGPSGSASYAVQGGGFLVLGRVALLSFVQPTTGRIWVSGSDATVKMAALVIA